MKKIIFLSAIIAFSFSCNEKKQETPKNSDLLADNLKGKVEQTVSTDYKVDSTGKIGELDSCCVATTKYDEKGYITEYSSSDKSGANVKKETFIHYDNGAMKDINDTKNGVQSSSISIQIDKDGKYATAQEFDSARKLKNYYTDITQNDYGQITSMKKYNSDSTLSGTFDEKFDKASYISGENKDSTGKVIGSSSAKYDDKNNIIERDEKSTIKDSTTTKITKYKYATFDDNGNWTERTETDENGKPLKIIKREITYYKD